MIVRGGECVVSAATYEKALEYAREEAAEHGATADVYELRATAKQEVTVHIVQQAQVKR